MMSSSIHVLLIEDNPGDARLVKEELQSVSSARIFHLEWVDRLEKGLERLVANPVDAVLLDLSLPDSEGLDTLQRVLSYAPQTPVIVMTGQADEEMALHAVQAGAQDYLIKGQVDGRLLTRSIQYSIERKQAERQTIQMKRLYATLSQVNQTIVRVKNHEELYQSICDVVVQFGEFALAWIGLLDESTGDVHPVAAHGLDVEQWPFPLVNIKAGPFVNGLTANAIRSSHVVTTDDLQADDTMKSLHELFKKYSYHAEAGVPLSLRGRTVGILNLVSDQAGFFQPLEEIHLLEEMGLDISFALDMIEREAERKLTQDQLEILKYSIDTAQDGAYWMDKDGRFLYVNEAGCKDLGYTREELLQMRVGDVSPRAADEAWPRIWQYLKENKNFTSESIHRRKDGSEFPVELTSTYIKFGEREYCNGFAKNITERKRAEQTLRDSEERLRLSLQAANQGLYDLNVQTGDAIVNRQYAEMLGYDPETFVETNAAWIERLHPEDRESVAKVYSDYVGGLRPEYRVEFRQRMKDGNWKWILSLGKVIEYDAEGNPLRMLGTHTDITERKQAEEKLRELENRMSGIVESAMDAMISVDANQLIVLANSAAGQMFGYAPDEMIGKPLELLLPERFRNAHAQQVRQFGTTGTTTRSMNALGTIHGLRSSGEEFPLEASISQISIGSDKMYTVILRDITERRQAEEQIQRQLKRLNALRMIDIAISSSFDLDIILDVMLQQVLSELNVDASAVSLFNTQMQTIEYAASRGFRSNAVQHTRLKLGEGYAGQAVLKRKTIHITDMMETDSKLARALHVQHESFVDYYGTPLIVKGEVKGVLEIYHRSHLKVDSEWLEFLEALAGQAAIAIDNAQLFENLQRSNLYLERRVIDRTAELNRANVELEHANRTKDEFLANMSHELRTPLTSVLGLSESLLEQQRDSLTEYQERSIQVIASSGRHLLELINDILDLSKIEAGKFDFYPQSISVDEICRSSLTFIKTQAAKKSITVTYENEASVSRMYADPRRLKQILVNLLSNAVKFSPENGNVTLQITSDSAMELIRFSVTDNGIGISEEDLKRLFQPFVQVDSSLNRQHEGTGLGLALVQRLTDLHGGSVHVESEVGKGSCFTIHLACHLDQIAKLEELQSHTASAVHEQAQKTEPASETATRAGVVLLAEDNMPNVLTIGEYLNNYHYEVVVAHDGLEAIKLAEEVNPDIILMDIQMPSMNGLEAIARLRDDFRFASTPIIALTALAMSGDRERCLAAGASEYMSKPVSLRLLLSTINELLGRPA